MWFDEEPGSYWSTLRRGIIFRITGYSPYVFYGLLEDPDAIYYANKIDRYFVYFLHHDINGAKRVHAVLLSEVEFIL